MNKKTITVHGIIIPADWDEQGGATAIAITTYDEDEYLIAQDEMGKELLSLIREELEITGEMGAQGKTKVLKVNHYSRKKGFMPTTGTGLA